MNNDGEDVRLWACRKCGNPTQGDLCVDCEVRLVTMDGETFSVREMREANMEDAEVLAALDRLERGESTSELIGFSWMEVPQ
jgi:hypothetical protein